MGITHYTLDGQHSAAPEYCLLQLQRLAFYVSDVSLLSSSVIEETSARKPSCAAPSKASIGPDGSAGSSSAGVFSAVVSPAAGSPCLFGLLRPAIYLTPETDADEAARRHCLAHERTHFRHGDHIWSALRCVCLALHWFDPLVWWAAALSRTDAELACDESTIGHLGESERASYGRTLLRMTCEKRPALHVTATMMTDSGRGLRERITLLVKKPRPQPTQRSHWCWWP